MKGGFSGFELLRVHEPKTSVTVYETVLKKDPGSARETGRPSNIEKENQK